MRIKDLITRTKALMEGTVYLAVDDATNNVTQKVDYKQLAKEIIEQYNTSTLAGSAQSVKAALDGLKTNLDGKTAFIKSALNLTKVDSGGSKTFTVASTTKSIMIAVAAEPNDQGMWFLNARSNGAVSVTAIRETSNITFTTGTNTLTINNASPANVFVAVIAFDGNGVTAQ